MFLRFVAMTIQYPLIKDIEVQSRHVFHPVHVVPRYDTSCIVYILVSCIVVDAVYVCMVRVIVLDCFILRLFLMAKN